MFLNKNTCRIVLSVIALILIMPLWSAYLKNYPVSRNQPDGTQLNLFVSGDEYYNWLHDKDGYTIKQNDQGWYVYLELSDKDLILTDLIVGRDNPNQRNINPWTNISSDEMKQKRLATQNQIRDIGGDRAPHTGTINNLVVFIRFSDQTEFGQSLSTYNLMFNGTTGNTMQSYFREASYNALNITSSYYPTTTTNVLSWQDSHIRGYYSPYNATSNPTGYQNDSAKTSREHALLAAAVNGISSQVSTSLNLDGDNDGDVDNVCFIIKGDTDEWAELLWPHRWSLYSQDVYINSKRVYDYNFQLSDFLFYSGTGVLCHEMFHSLGAPDLYHYSYDGFSPVGSWDLMEQDSNPPQHMGAYMKWKYVGWISSIPTISANQSYSLNPLTSATGNAYRINSPNSTSEYYVVEFRKATGTFESQLPGSGLLVYRINTNAGDGNAEGPPDEVYLYRPGGTTTNDGNVDNANYSSETGRTSINSATNPVPFLSNGTIGGLVLSNIGPAAGSTISFNLGTDSEVILYGFVNGSNAPTVGLSGVSVTAGAYTETTDASGYYSMIIPSGTYTITAAKAGYNPSIQTNVLLADILCEVNFTLTQSNFIVNESFDSTVFPPIGWSTISVNGNYIWERVTSGTHPTCAPHSGLGFAKYNSYDAQIGQGANLVTPSFSVTPGQLYSVSFWMYRDTGSPSNADKLRLYSNGSPNTTNATLIATINRLTTQSPVETTSGWHHYTYEFTPVASGGNSYLILNSLSAYGNNIFIDDVVISESAPTTGTLSGTVTSSGNPLATATVSLVGTQQTTTTGANGMYSFLTITPGQYQVTCSKTGYSSQTLSTTITANQTTTLNFTLTDITQPIPLITGWNLVSLNVSPPNNSIATLFAPIQVSLLQIKGVDGIYIPNNPFNTLTNLTNGKAYNVKMSQNATWSVSGAAIAQSTPLSLNDGWNMVAYLPQVSSGTSTAMQSISTWLNQVKGTDGIYIPGNPFNTLNTMYPGKGYWVNITGAHTLTYPGRDITRSETSSIGRSKSNILPISPVILSNSMTALIRCDIAQQGDYISAYVNDECRAIEPIKVYNGITGALMQIYTEQSGEIISFRLLHSDTRQCDMLETNLTSEPGNMIGDYEIGQYLSLFGTATGNEENLAQPTELLGCYPNPFSMRISIKFNVAANNEPVTIEVYNIRGQKVRVLSDNRLKSGKQNIIWNGLDDGGNKVTSGVYFIKMQSSQYQKTIKILLTR